MAFSAIRSAADLWAEYTRLVTHWRFRCGRPSAEVAKYFGVTEQELAGTENEIIANTSQSERACRIFHSDNCRLDIWQGAPKLGKCSTCGHLVFLPCLRCYLVDRGYTQGKNDDDEEVSAGEFIPLELEQEMHDRLEEVRKARILNDLKKKAPDDMYRLGLLAPAEATRTLFSQLHRGRTLGQPLIA